MLAPPPLSHLSLASFLLGIQEVLCKCILDGRATGAIGVSAGLQDAEVGGYQQASGRVSVSPPGSLLSSTLRTCKFPQAMFPPSVDPHSLGPAPWDLDKSL